MLQAENCIITHPDSALFYLSTFKNEIKNEPEETQMYYNLLTIKAEDKLYIPHTSDSLIKVITKFYEEYDDNDKLMEAYYYMGSTYRDMKDAPRALRAFQDAVDVGKDSKLYDIIAQTYGQIGTLFTYQGLYDESLNAIKLSSKYHSLSNNYAKISIALRNIARICIIKEKKDSALHYYKTAYAYASKTKDTQIINSFLSELGCFYYDIGKKDSAKVMLIKAINENYDIKNARLNLGIIYQDEEKIDSAEYYFHFIIKSEDIYKKRHAYMHLSQIEAKKEHYIKALYYINEFNKLRDSIETMTQTEAINKIQALYNYQHTEKENDQLKLDNERKKNLFYQLLFLFMASIITSFIIIIQTKRKKQRAVEQEQNLLKIKEEQYLQSLECIEDNNKKIKELELKLCEAKENDIINKTIIQSQKEKLEQTNNFVVAVRNEQSILEASFKQSNLYLLFHKVGNDETIKITETEWLELQCEIDKIYHNFTDHLYILYPQISLLELRICYLIKISMQVKDIANILNRSKPAISIARTRLYKKIHRTEGSVEMFDKFILNL